MRGHRIKGRHPRSAGGTVDAHDLVDRRAINQAEWIAIALEQFDLRLPMLVLGHQRQAGEIIKRTNVTRLQSGRCEFAAINSNTRDYT